MKIQRFTYKLCSMAIATTLLSGLAASTLQAQPTNMVDNATLQEVNGKANFEIRFIEPVSLLSGVRSGSGELVRIEVQQRTVTWSASEPSIDLSIPEAKGLYDYIRFSPLSESRGSLEIRFPGTVSYRITPSRDARGISVHTDIPLTPPHLTPVDNRQAAPPSSIVQGSGKTAEWLERARIAMVDGKYDLAIQLYTNITQFPESPEAKQALEYLGVARERKGQYAHARAIYQRYLRSYPKDASVTRIEQRLQSLLSRADVPRKKLRAAKSRSEQREVQQAKWELYGSLYQYYRKEDLHFDNSGDVAIENSLSTDVDLRARRRGPRFNIDSRLSIGHIADGRDSGENSERMRAAYVDIEDKNGNREIRIGRQSGHSGGTLGRFDGVRLSQSFGSNTTVHLVAGHPVRSTSDIAIESDTRFYGANVDFGPYDSGWEYNLFAIQQDSEGMLDRQATGAEARYFKDGVSLFALLDYDISYAELNTALFIGSLTTAANTTYSLTYDWRKSPILTTRNALQGQGLDSLDELKLLFTEAEIELLAQDRTPESTLVNFGINHPINDQLQIYANISGSELTGTSSSGGVLGFDGTPMEFSYDLQLMGFGWLIENDSHLFGIRYYDGENLQRAQLTFDGRYPITHSLRINPRLRFELRERGDANLEEQRLRISTKLEYRWRRKYFFEMEVGGEWSNQELTPLIEEDSDGTFFLVGYRIDF